MTTLSHNIRIIAFLLAFISLDAVGLTLPTGGNWIVEATALQPATTLPQDDGVRYVVRHFDGLGREVGQVDVGAAANGSDMASYITYDSRNVIDKQYLPLNTGSNTGEFVRTASLWPVYYGEDYAYTEILYDHTLENKPEAVIKPGVAWRQNGTHSSHFHHTFNTTLTSQSSRLHCVNYYIDEDGKLAMRGYYGAATLSVDIVADEDGRETATFTDKFGRKILFRQYDEDNQQVSDWPDTYFVYDDYGRLTYIISPEAANHFETEQNANGLCDSSYIDKLCFVYQYDELDRVVSKKLPGVDAIYYVYDKLNRAIMWQDGEQRQQGRWSVRYYDTQQRVAVEGQATMATATHASLQAMWGDTLLLAQYNPTTLMEFNLKYDNTGQTSNFTPERAYYYDNYSHWDNYVPLPTESGFPNVYNLSAKGLTTGSAATDDNGNVAVILNGYDEKNRLIVNAERDVYANNYLIKSFFDCDFTGRVTSSTRYTQLLAEQQVLTNYKEQWTYTYDNHDRLISARHRYGNHDWHSLGDYLYDDLGHVVGYQCGTLDNNIIDTEYSYDIRGKLTEQSGRHFSQNIFYHTFEGGNAPSFIPSYNGNIAALTETRLNDAGQYVNRSRFFEYDGMSRLLNVHDNDPFRYEESFSYDFNGNILTLRRGGEQDSYDDLSFSYDGNQLIGITDEPRYDSYLGEIAQVVEGEYDDAIEYDRNGRVTKDLSRGITDITYNIVSLPRFIEMGNDDVITNSYRADGVKTGENTSHSYIERIKRWDRRLKDSVWVDVQRYNTVYYRYYGNMVRSLNSTVPVRIYNEAGYIDIATDGSDSVSYHFYERDYLGNIRAIVDENDSVEQVVDYLSGGIPVASQNIALVDRHLHTGKEYQAFNGLAWYNNNARIYDPLYMRFTTLDGLAEEYPHLSPYIHVADNPINNTDPTGLFIRVLNEDQQLFLYGLSTVFEINAEDFMFNNENVLAYKGNNDLLSYDQQILFDGLQQIINNPYIETLVLFDYQLNIMDKKTGIERPISAYETGGEGTYLLSDGYDKNYILVATDINIVLTTDAIQEPDNGNYPYSYRTDYVDLLFHGLGHVIFDKDFQNKVIDYQNVERRIRKMPNINYYKNHYEYNK